MVYPMRCSPKPYTVRKLRLRGTAVAEAMQALSMFREKCLKAPSLLYLAPALLTDTIQPQKLRGSMPASVFLFSFPFLWWMHGERGWEEEG